jgi:uncharacterized membrane protein YdjX (TVP38/TMEM64 family)
LKNFLKFFCLLAFIVFSWHYGKTLDFDLAGFLSFFDQMPQAISAILFIGGYVLITFVAWLAKDLLKIVGAMVFGASVSTLLIWIAEMINVFLLFTLSRYLGRDFVKKYLFKGKLAHIDKRLGEVGAIELFLLRALPVIPFRFLDVAAGLTKIPFYFYFIWVALASPIRIFWVQFILAGVGDSLLKDPSALVLYFMEHQYLFMVSFVYLMISLAAVVYDQCYRTKERRKA